MKHNRMKWYSSVGLLIIGVVLGVNHFIGLSS